MPDGNDTASQTRPAPITDAIQEVARRAPLMLNAEVMHKIDGSEKALRYTDDHLFTVQLPAWVFRALKESK